MKNKAQIIVALDVFSFEEARKLVDILSGVVDIFKVGSQLFTACGPVIVRYIQGKGKKVFLDLKYHDIPNTVANAVGSAVSLAKPVYDVLDSGGKSLGFTPGLFMLTLHIVGGEEMLNRAVETAGMKAKEFNVPKPLLVAITVLTSDKSEGNTTGLVLERARLAKKCGLDGVVASGLEVKALREELGKDFVIVTPGIRPSGSKSDDQKRVITAKDAALMGSNFLVVGRPIVESKDPLESAKQILKEIS